MTENNKDLEGKLSEELKKLRRNEIKLNREEKKRYTNIHLKKELE
jgi:hypothetical protein